MTRPEIQRMAFAALAVCACGLATCVAVLNAPVQAQTTQAQTVQAQTGKTISIRMFDARTAQPIVPSNFLVRLDHQDELRNESLRVSDDGVGAVTVPDNAAFLSVQGTYDRSMEIYINCDAGMEKDSSTMHWYSIADILSAGVIAPNKCYKGKYERNPRVTAKPGELDFFVRKVNGWRDDLTN